MKLDGCCSVPPCSIHQGILTGWWKSFRVMQTVDLILASQYKFSLEPFGRTMSFLTFVNPISKLFLLHYEDWLAMAFLCLIGSCLSAISVFVLSESLNLWWDLTVCMKTMVVKFALPIYRWISTYMTLLPGGLNRGGKN